MSVSSRSAKRLAINNFCEVLGVFEVCHGSFGIVDLIFNEKESCLCCPQCGELIEDGDDNDDNS
jgi:hypothetical protein